MVHLPVETHNPHGISDKRNHSNELAMQMVALMPSMPAYDNNHNHTTTQYNSSATVVIDTIDNRRIREEITKFSDKSLPETALLDSTASNLHR